MKHYVEATVLKFYINFEDPEVIGALEDMSDLVNEMGPKLYRIALDQGLVAKNDYLPPGTLCRIVERTPHLVVRMIIPPRLI